MTDLTHLIAGFANFIGSLICHQLPSRTLNAGGLPLPVCARDMGIYLGIFVGAAFILVSGRLRSDRPPGLAETIAMCVLMVPMIADGAGSYLGFYTTNNTARLLTGVLFGLQVPLLMVPAANFKVDARNEIPVLRGFGELGGITALSVLICILILSGLVPYIILALIFVVSFLFLIWRVSYTVIARGFRFKPIYRSLASAGATLCIISALYLVSTLALQPIKAVILR